MTNLENQVAVITGAAGGIGRACAEDFAYRGAHVVIADLPGTAGREVVASIKKEGGKAIFVACDILNPGEVEGLMNKAVDHFGGLHIGVNNAGILGAQVPTAEYTLEDWQQVLAVNLTGVFLCMKYQIQHMREGGGGSIVNISSIAGKVGYPAAPAYTASKHGVVGLTRAAALDHAPENIRINALGPAAIDTSMLATVKADKERYAGLVAAHPLGRVGEPSEVAAFAAFLASDEASFVTGNFYAVDGGYLAQ